MLWVTGSLASKPKFELGGWSVVEADQGSRHLVGIDLTNGTGQVSSAIQTFDRVAMRCVTSSGRVYALHQVSGIRTENAWYVWDAWCRVNGVKSWTDVTEQYQSADRP